MARMPFGLASATVSSGFSEAVKRINEIAG